MDGADAALGWGRNASYPYQEGSFFGNIFKAASPVANYCNGVDFEFGVVPGRLGANQSGAPYTNPLGPTGLCNSMCTAGGGALPHNDGYTVCYGVGGIAYRHVVTVYRDFVPTSQYKICDKLTGYCLAAANTTAGSQIVKAAYSTTNTKQKWTITQTTTGSGQYKVLNVATHMVLDMAGSKAAVNTALVQAASTGSATQSWSFKSVADGTGFFQIQPSSTTLNALGTSSGNNMQLEAWSWNDDEKLSVALAN